MERRVLSPAIKRSMMPDETDEGASPVSEPARAKTRQGTIRSSAAVDIGAVSHEGKVRLNNEDSFLVVSFGRSMHTVVTNLPAGHVPERYRERGYAMLVADGMGGQAAGEVASRLVISTFVDLLIQTPDWLLLPNEKRVMEVLRRMEERFDKLPDALQNHARANPDLADMGTTLTLAVSLGVDLIIAHVGASRAYLFRRGHLLLLTRDQTVAQVLAESGIIRHEDVPKHHGRRLLLGSISASGKKAEVDLYYLRLADGDQLLLCTDGLTEMASDERISAVLEKNDPAADACRALVDMALEAGGTDNVTVVLGRYHIPEEGAGETGRLTSMTSE